MSTCPICHEPLDPKGRVFHRCTGPSDGAPPPRPEQAGFVPPSQGSRTPVVVIAAVLVLLAGVAIAALVAGRDDGAVTSPASSDATGTTEIVTTSAADTVVDTTVPVSVVPTVADTVPPTPVPTAAPTEIAVASTPCTGTTVSGTVPTSWLNALSQAGPTLSCRVAGQWAFASWTNAINGANEAGLFRLDQPFENAYWMPLVELTPTGCIENIVQDPPVAAELTVGLPVGTC